MGEKGRSTMLVSCSVSAKRTSSSNFSSGDSPVKGKVKNAREVSEDKDVQYYSLLFHRTIDYSMDFKNIASNEDVNAGIVLHTTGTWQ